MIISPSAFEVALKEFAALGNRAAESKAKDKTAEEMYRDFRKELNKNFPINKGK